MSMPPFFPARSALRLAALMLAGLAACRDPDRVGEPPPPYAEFVLAAGDSAFWVTSAPGALRMRGAPLELARVNGRFYELYVADDDRSFGDANLVGQRVYRRDLVTGDSMLVFEDTLVPHLARLYARLHPDDRPLGADDDPSEDPLWSATATLDLGEVQGPYVSYALHTDVERNDKGRWHTSRQGVLDIAHGGAVTLATVAGSATSRVERERAEYLRGALDSVRRTGGERGARALATLPNYQLDPSSFSLTTVDGAPAVAYALPGAGDGDAGHLLPLPPIRIGDPAWWPAVAATLPIGSSDGRRDVWRHRGYGVVVHYDSVGSAGRLALRDSTSREWSIGRVPAPAVRIFWLDTPAIDSTARVALARAFEESSLYDDAVRTASLPLPRHRVASPPRPRASLARRPAAAPRLPRLRARERHS
jgi:hypothetical protein